MTPTGIVPTFEKPEDRHARLSIGLELTPVEEFAFKRCEESQHVFLINSFLIRASFWAVLVIGLIDVSLSMLRSEGLLNSDFGETLAVQQRVTYR